MPTVAEPRHLGPLRGSQISRAHPAPLTNPEPRELASPMVCQKPLSQKPLPITFRVDTANHLWNLLLMDEKPEFRPRGGVNGATYNTFSASVGVSGGCWVWRQPPGGFGRAKRAGFRVLGQHRSPQWISWYLHFGVPAAKSRVMTTCDNENCVNPDHLVTIPIYHMCDLAQDMVNGKVVFEIVRDCGLPRSTIYRMIRKYRADMEIPGL